MMTVLWVEAKDSVGTWVTESDRQLVADSCLPGWEQQVQQDRGTGGTVFGFHCSREYQDLDTWNS